LVSLSDQLKRYYNLGEYWLDIDLEDLMHYDNALAEKLTKQPTDHLPLVSSNATIFFLNGLK